MGATVDNHSPGHLGSQAEASRVGFTTVYGQRFADRVAELEQWLNQHDSCLPRLSGAGVTPQEHALADWVGKQRATYRLRPPRSMNADRVAALEALPGWTWSRADETWLRNYRQLVAWLDQHQGQYPRTGGSGRSPQETQLGDWVAYQRSTRRTGRRGGLLPQREATLEALPGWVWSQRVKGTPQPWEDRYQQLRGFLNTHGRLPTARNGELTQEGTMRAWLRTQVASRDSGRLSAERVRALESLPGWSVREHGWFLKDHIVKIKAFHETHAREPEPLAADAVEADLAQWSMRQRSDWRSGVMPTSEAAQFEYLLGTSWTWIEPAVVQRIVEALVVALAATLVELNPRELNYLNTRILADDERRLSLAELGRREGGMSRAGAYLVESKLLAKLRHPLLLGAVRARAPWLQLSITSPWACRSDVARLVLQAWHGLGEPQRRIQVIAELLRSHAGVRLSLGG